MAYNAGLDDRLSGVTEEEERRREAALEAQRQGERLAASVFNDGQVSPEEDQQQQMGRAQQLRQQAQNRLKEQALQRVRKEGAKKIEQVAVRSGGLRVIFLNPYVLAAIAIVIIIFVLIAGIIMAMTSMCNDSGWAAKGIKWADWLGEKFGLTEGVCKNFVLAPSQGSAVPATDTQGNRTPDQLGLVAISGVPVDPNLAAERARLRPCMLNMLQQLYAQSVAAGAGQFVVTSAYRPEGVRTYHNSGEAFDIAFRPPLPFFSNDPRIATVVNIARNLGFTQPRGNVVDEYNRPSNRTEGPHIHVEFNYDQPNGQSYCDYVIT